MSLESFDKAVSSAFHADVFEGQGELCTLGSLGIWGLLNLHELPKCTLKFIGTGV